ncbi:MAG: tetrahydrodipicolinate N-succinyltransferase N-terminal domain-containing protein [Candidatus Nanopelagicales bacterium]
MSAYLNAEAVGVGLATYQKGQILDVWFPSPALGSLASEVSLAESENEILGTSLRIVDVIIPDLSKEIQSVEDAYLRLHLLSHRIVRPRSINLDGLFQVLPNNVWTNRGPLLGSEFPGAKARAMSLQENLTVLSVDKFPRMIDYVIPSGVRIADGDRVRLGAYLAEGTTVMHEGFVNFNAGTLGTSMVEGRISAGVIVGEGSDIGGGASIMGTLSGGGKEVITIGEKCLIGANAGLGISLGNNCIIEAGTYITAGSKVTLPDGTVVKARALSGQNDLLFRRNSLDGKLEVFGTRGEWNGLNAQLHSDN